MKVRIHRFDPETNTKSLVTYEVKVNAQSMTVMDVLDDILVNQDSTLAFYKHSVCNHGICGRCSLLVNGVIKLACITQIDPTGELELAPMPKRHLIRDLVTKL